MKIRVQREDFDPGTEIAALGRGASAGAVATFVGLVREESEGARIRTMTLEHYPGMTERAIGTIAQEACRRWRVLDLTVIHRVGELKPGDRIVLVAVASAHRGDAFAACEFIMDYLKTRAPFWKKENTALGARWVEARASDDAAAARWEEAVRKAG